ncbi:MbnP family protein [Tenacibaculum maritimum]|uniref:Probable lipoprotein n=1 Tax=Tenacibaculum maritimum NCIMB 2154 TaxID=1349785 RepID=A0A2H1EDA9_9FLAO|nr:MbnP family protein [Tenacibaculum maritimum]CAA0194457.1 Probable lipoprotein precursor [Tenacibaculum maritimum]SFZ85039.1 Probable lipoprotein precursor [Tenacibaculum maritimum NCIMB 2154]
MKKIFTLLAITSIFTFTSCSDDDTPITHGGKNNVSIEFDSSFNEDDLILGSSYINGNGENLTISSFDYIVSNFVLITEEGKEVPYPKEKSYFIISEGGNGKDKNVKVMLKDMPAGKYIKMRFGIGVDQKRYMEGQAAQEEFWTKAEGYNLTWNWQAGYKFVVLEGNVKTSGQADKEKFMLHIASRGTSIDLYKEVEVSMETALVDHDKSPQIHIKVDASKMLDGTHKIKLSEGTTIMGGEKASLIADNNKEMFAVHHVHNGSDSHH